MTRRLVMVFVWGTVMLLVFGCILTNELFSDGGQNGGGEPLPENLRTQAQTDGLPLSSFSIPPYSANSIWNQPIPANVPIDPNSEAMIALLVDDVRNGDPPVLSVREWTYTVYLADEDTQRQDIALTASWSPFAAMRSVPVPNGALPDPQGDGHMTIIDLSTGYEYDFWQVKQRKDGSWSASWGNRISLSSDGIYPYGMGARGSGFASLAGLIWPQEFQQEKINHALFFAIPHVASGGPVWPATESDGVSHQEGAIPEGARIQLDPGLDLDQFSLTPYERIIADALQTYGGFVGDRGGSVSIKAVNAISYPEDPYPAGWFDMRWVLLTDLPWEYMRVLELSPQTPDIPLHVEDESIYTP